MTIADRNVTNAWEECNKYLHKCRNVTNALHKCNIADRNVTNDIVKCW